MSSSAGFGSLQNDREFSALYKSLRRTNTHPTTMARDAKSNHGGKARRSSTTSSQTTASRSRFSAVGGAVQPQGGYAGSAIDNVSESGWSNVTGFRSPRRLNVPDSPGSTYFNSGASRFDRRAEYIGRPLTGSCLVTNEPARNQAGEEWEPEDSEDEEDEDATILPSDSASQVGKGRRESSRSKPQPPLSKSGGLFGEVSRGRQQPQPRRANPPSPFAVQRSHTYSNGDDQSMSGARRAHDGGRRYSVVERKPQGF